MCATKTLTVTQKETEALNGGLGLGIKNWKRLTKMKRNKEYDKKRMKHPKEAAKLQECSAIYVLLVFS